MFKNNDEIVIKPIKGLVGFDIKEIWRYRELLWTFTWRDIKVRYKQTALGILWAFLPPLLSMVVFSVIFGNFIKTPDNIPYPIFVFTGTLIWNYFSNSLSFSSNSLVNYQSMIRKIYFPRLLLPLSSIIAGLLDFLISLSILIMLMIYYQIFPEPIALITIPILIFITIFSALGFGLVLAAINVKYRDVKYIVPFFLQLGLFITPVIYPTSLLEQWSILLWINPMTSVIETSRTVLLNTGEVNWILLCFSVVESVFYFLIGLFYFKQSERYFADVI